MKKQIISFLIRQKGTRTRTAFYRGAVPATTSLGCGTPQKQLPLVIVLRQTVLASQARLVVASTAPAKADAQIASS